LGPLLSMMKGESDITSLLTHLPELISTQFLKVTFYFFLQMCQLTTSSSVILHSPFYQTLSAIFMVLSIAGKVNLQKFFVLHQFIYLYVCKMFKKYVVKTLVATIKCTNSSSRTNQFESNCRLTHRHVYLPLQNIIFNT
jgi:hypothetical protein